MRIVGAVLLLALLPAYADAAPAQIDEITVAAACGSCHGAEAEPGGIPRLTGQPARLLEEKLLAYRRGSLQGTLMNRIARGFDEAELKAIAAVLGTPE